MTYTYHSDYGDQLKVNKDGSLSITATEPQEDGKSVFDIKVEDSKKVHAALFSIFTRTTADIIDQTKSIAKEIMVNAFNAQYVVDFEDYSASPNTTEAWNLACMAQLAITGVDVNQLTVKHRQQTNRDKLAKELLSLATGTLHNFDVVSAAVGLPYIGLTDEEIGLIKSFRDSPSKHSDVPALLKIAIKLLEFNS